MDAKSPYHRGSLTQGQDQQQMESPSRPLAGSGSQLLSPLSSSYQSRTDRCPYGPSQLLEGIAHGIAIWMHFFRQTLQGIGQDIPCRQPLSQGEHRINGCKPGDSRLSQGKLIKQETEDNGTAA